MDDSSRISKLEKEIEDLKDWLCDKPKKDKKQKEPSPYNIFVKEYISEQKNKLGDSYNHKVAFKSAAEAWSKKKSEK